MIPLFDLTRQYLKLRGEILNAVDKVISSGRVILGENVRRFEEELAEYLGVRCVVGVSNGTDALILAMKALNVECGDVVITTPYTFIASASAALWTGGFPAFVDVEEDSMNMNLNDLTTLLSGTEGGFNPERVKSVVFVHLFGRSLDLDRLKEIRERYNIPIVEDVAQALGAEWKRKDGTVVKAGSVSDIATFSFFPTKNLGTYGDGGAVATNNDELCEILRMLRTHGSKKRYEHELLGKNARLDEIHAAVLRIKLKYLDQWNDRRIGIAKLYGRLFEEMNLVEYLDYPKPVEGFKGHVFHQFVVKFKEPEYREKVIEKFKERGIGFAVYYPKPLHLQPVFKRLGFSEGDFPVAEKLSRTTLALPIFPELRDDEVETVALTIKNALEV